MNKKRICLVTTWYPTPQNPYQGSFFKEQAFALAEHFDFLVLHYKEYIKKQPGTKYVVSKCNSEKNTEEYNISVYLPPTVYIADAITTFKTKHIKRRGIEGVGRYTSLRRTKVTKKILQKILLENFPDSFDVLYCVNAQNEAKILKMISDIVHKPYVVGEHAPFPWPGTTISDCSKYAIECADLFLAISYDKIRQILLQNVKLPKIVYIGNMIDENQFVYKKKVDNLHIKTFVIVASCSFFKNYDLFIQIIDRLAEITKVPFKVLITGYGADKGYSKNPEIFEEKIRNSKFANYAELIPEVEHEQIQNIYNRADAFIMTSIQEGMPLSALEAACCGLPIFSTMCGGVEDYIIEEIGRIYKIVDYESFSDGLRDFLEGKIVFDSDYIRKYIVEHFGRKIFVKKFSEAFDTVIDNSKNT